MTSHPYQTEVDIHVYQGDDEDALKNIPVGDFRVEGPDRDGGCRTRFSAACASTWTAFSRSRRWKSGPANRSTSGSRMLRAQEPREIAAGRQRIRQLYGSREDFDDGVIDAAAEEIGALSDGNVIPIESAAAKTRPGEAADKLLERSRRLLDSMHEDDREEAIGLHEQIAAAVESGDEEALRRASAELRDLLFFIEGGTAG